MPVMVELGYLSPTECLFVLAWSVRVVQGCRLVMLDKTASAS